MPPHVKDVILVGAAHCYNKGKNYVHTLGLNLNFVMFIIIKNN